MIATPFIRKASEHFEVTLLAKPFAVEMQPRFWPGVTVIPFVAPWTAFELHQKYNLLKWPWKKIFKIWRYLVNERFDVALSARWDPRDHFLLQISGARARLGFPRTGSSIFLTHRLETPARTEHRYENWRVIAAQLKLNPEPFKAVTFTRVGTGGRILVHSGAAQQVRVWPLENYRKIVAKLRSIGHEVLVVCNPDQLDWWKRSGEHDAVSPGSINELIDLLDHSAAFIGNDSGPGHLAAFCGIPTFTFFGPQVPEWWAPLSPQGEYIEGKPCPFKPCSDYCRFAEARCLVETTEEEAWQRIRRFSERNLRNHRIEAMAAAR